MGEAAQVPTQWAWDVSGGVAAVRVFAVRGKRQRSRRREEILMRRFMTVLVSIVSTLPSYRCFVESRA
jgi:hypothetical protein